MKPDIKKALNMLVGKLKSFFVLILSTSVEILNRKKVGKSLESKVLLFDFHVYYLQTFYILCVRTLCDGREMRATLFLVRYQLTMNEVNANKSLQFYHGACRFESKHRKLLYQNKQHNLICFKRSIQKIVLFQI